MRPTPTAGVLEWKWKLLFKRTCDLCCRMFGIKFKKKSSIYFMNWFQILYPLRTFPDRHLSNIGTAVLWGFFFWCCFVFFMHLHTSTSPCAAVQRSGLIYTARPKQHHSSFLSCSLPVPGNVYFNKFWSHKTKTRSVSIRPQTWVFPLHT